MTLVSCSSLCSEASRGLDLINVSFLCYTNCTRSMCDENKASVRGPDPKSQTKRRCGPLPRGAYKLFLAYFRTGSVPTTAEMIFGDLFESRLFSTYRKESRPVQEQHFRDLASLMRLSSGDSNVLECVATGRTMLPKEEFSDMVTMIHTHEGLAGPGHRGILSTISQARGKDLLL